MPSEAPAAGVEQDLHRKVEQLTRELAGARAAERALARELAQASEQQAATADVLRTISRSALDLQSVLGELVSSASRLCDAPMVAIHVQSENSLPGRARIGFPPDMVQALGTIGQVMGRGSLVGRVLADGHAVHIPDVAADTEYTFRDFTRVTGARSMLGLPLLRDGKPVGILSLYRTSVSPFTSRQVELISTFADQAVIAIENARLFEEVQARTRELAESLEYQTATSDVLQVISSSLGRLQPVYDAMLASALRNCDAKFGGLFRYDDGGFHGVAAIGIPDDVVASAEPILGPELTQLVASRRPIHSPDLRQNPSYLAGDPFIVRTVERGGARAALLVPLIKDDSLVGAFAIYRQDARPFTEKQIQLVETFADQAVIAIENARLLEAEEASKRDLRVSLEYQTAISDVLGVISRSQFALQPVLQSVVETAVRLCRADHAMIYRRKEGAYQFAAGFGPYGKEYLEIERKQHIPPGPGTLVGRVALARTSVKIDDALADSAYEKKDDARIGNIRSMLGVPLIRDGDVAGIIGLVRNRVEPFNQRETDLITTFADQAVIAIENTRLFEEVQARTRESTERSQELAKALEQQTATGEVLSVISRSPTDVQPVFDAIALSAAQLCNAELCNVFRFDGQHLHVVASHLPTALEAQYANARQPPVRPGRGTAAARAIVSNSVAEIPDVEADPEYERGHIAKVANLRSVLAVPMLKHGRPIGAIAVARSERGRFPDRQVELLKTFADQAVIAIENTRLFNEITQKSRELELASQHKSQFVANMSHELRTPLAAILGYAELIQEGFYGPLPQKSIDALARIRSNGKHLLGLINTVLDIAKIESGQFSLNLGEYALETVVETVRGATESLAATKKLAFNTEIAKSLPIGLGDEQRLTQVLLNLVGNAIKFTDAGEVRVTAGAENGHFAVAVTDTGPGIPAEEQTRVFDQFHQVDSSNTKAKGGTGLGLAISKQIVEMHGGRIWVESTLGNGATFRMQLPIRAETVKVAT